MKFKIFKKFILNSILSLLYSNECILCLDEISYSSVICEKCFADIHEKNKKRCDICSLEIEEEGLCGQCILKHPTYKRHVSFGEYNGSLRKLIIKYKFNEFEKLKYFFSHLYLELISRELGFEFDWIIAVPGDKSRNRRFDPTLETSKIVSRKSGIPFLKNKLIKVKSTEPQTGLGYHKRIKNLNGAFKLSDVESLKNRRVLLIDDVYTTGTTIKKCADVIGKETKDIYAVTLARSRDLFKDL